MGTGLRRAKLRRMLRHTLPVAATAAVLLLPATAGAATYKVTSATHSSSSQKTATGYEGRSTASWTLARPAKLAVAGGGGMAMVKVRGSYAVDITTTFPGRCAWSAPTGSSTYPMVAPGEVALQVMSDPAARGKRRVTFMGQQAALGNGYLGTECSTSISGEPSAMETGTKTVAASTFRRKTVTLTFAGATNRDGIAYRWSTKVVLKRVKR